MRPVNATAARVVSSGTHFNSRKIIQEFESTSPHPIKPLPFNAEDLTGIRFGRFTVLGMSRELKKRWVVRCDCGMYSIRRRKSILNPANKLDRCGECLEQIQIKKAYHYSKTGVDLPREHFDN